MFGRKQNKINKLNKKCKKLEKQLSEIKLRNEELEEKRTLDARNNTRILEQDNKKTKLIKDIKELLEINKYDNEKAVLNKIKELVSDYQSIN